MFATDLKFLEQTLQALIPFRGTDGWFTQANAKLTQHLGTQHPVYDSTKLRLILMDGDVRGALRQAIILYLRSQTKLDLLTGEPLDWFTEERKASVDLHHIFPRKWCQDNTAHHPILQDESATIDGLANLVPLTASSNNKWKTKSPATALRDFQLTWRDHASRFEMALVDEQAFSMLTATPANPDAFWLHRASTIALKLEGLQKVCR